MFALRVAGGQISHGSMKNITLSLNTIVAFLGATLRSIRQNDAIKQFLSNITGGNTRSVIELITTFCGSPNVDAQKIVDIELERGNYIVPIHEFTKHALLGEFAYFNSQSSFVACNVFDVTSADPREHFLASLAVSFLASNLGIRDNDGFVTGETISAEMSLHGFTENQTRSALRRLASKRLVETPYLHYREIKVEEGYDPLNFHYRATSIGIYHVRFWTGSFSFLDAMSTDTPIFYEDTRAQVSKLAASFEIAARLTKTTAFKGYLEAQWHSASIHCTYYNFTNLIVAGADTFKIVESVVSRTIPKRPFLDNRPRAWRGSA